MIYCLFTSDNCQFTKVKKRGHELYVTLLTGRGPSPDFVLGLLKSPNSVGNNTQPSSY